MDINQGYEQDYSGRGSMDHSGRGAVIAQPIADPKTAQMNMQSLMPNSRLAPVTAINAVAAPQVAADKKKKEQVDGGQAPTTAAYEAESFDFDSIFDGENLTEEFKEKIKVVFEAAVNERVNFIAANLAQQANTALEEQVNLVSESLSEKLDDYLNYVIEEWMTENKLALEDGIRMDIAESFLSGLKELFESHYVRVPEGRVDILENIVSQKNNLEQEINEKIEENINLKKLLAEQQCAIVFNQATHGLTDVQVEKLASLAEGLQYDSVEQYAEKLNILKESYFRSSVSQYTTTRETIQSLQESTDKRIEQPGDHMGMYLSAISRQAKKN